jgi:hypothetical protein
MGKVKKPTGHTGPVGKRKIAVTLHHKFLLARAPARTCPAFVVNL